MSFPARISGRALALLLALAGALGVAFVVAPRMLAANESSGDLADRRNLVTAAHNSFDGYWRTGDPEFSADLKEVVGYWFRYHLAKATIAALLLVVFIVLAVLVFGALLRASGTSARYRAVLASAGGTVTMLALACLLTVMANVQGAVAPFASLLPLVTEGAADPRLAETLDQVRQALGDSSGGHRNPAVLQVMVKDFSRYHVALAVVAALAALSFTGLSVMFWRRFARAASDRRRRRAFGSFGAFAALLVLVFIIVAVANTTTAAQPEPALLAFFNGRW